MFQGRDFLLSDGSVALAFKIFYPFPIAMILGGGITSGQPVVNAVPGWNCVRENSDPGRGADRGSTKRMVKPHTRGSQLIKIRGFQIPASGAVHGPVPLIVG
jgi:hypothetical protein